MPHTGKANERFGSILLTSRDLAGERKFPWKTRSVTRSLWTGQAVKTSDQRICFSCFWRSATPQTRLLLHLRAAQSRGTAIQIHTQDPNRGLLNTSQKQPGRKSPKTRLGGGLGHKTACKHQTRSRCSKSAPAPLAPLLTAACSPAASTHPTGTPGSCCSGLAAPKSPPFRWGGWGDEISPPHRDSDPCYPLCRGGRAPDSSPQRFAREGLVKKYI